MPDKGLNQPLQIIFKSACSRLIFRPDSYILAETHTCFPYKHEGIRTITI